MTRCEQLDSLLQERGEGICPLEAIHDQVGSVVPSELEGASAVDECTRSLGGMEAPEPLVVARIPSVNVPVCVVSSVSKCVLKRMHSVEEIASVSEKVCVDETTCVKETPCVSCVVASVPKCVLPSTPCVDEAPRVRETVCVSERVRIEETASVSNMVCVSETARVSNLKKVE